MLPGRLIPVGGIPAALGLDWGIERGGGYLGRGAAEGNTMRRRL
jgi:hypothetical protein